MPSISRKRSLQLILLTWVFIQVPFLAVAFRIDEPNIIAIAKHIAVHPGDPYGFIINWNGIPEVAFNVLANPPVHPAYLSLWRGGGEWSETMLHLSILPFSILALVAVFFLSEEFGKDPLWSTIAVAGSPAFLVASGVVMPDLTMLALFLCSFAASVRYQRNGERLAGAIAFVTAFLAPLFKYNGILLIPVIGCLWLFSTPRRKGVLLIAAAPLLGLALWSFWSWWIYGRAHFLAMTGFEHGSSVDIFNGSFACFGLGVLPLAALLLPETKSAIQDVVGVAIGLLMAGAAVLIIGYPPVQAIWFGIGTGLTARFLVFAVNSGLRGPFRSALTLVLILWILGVFLFQFNLLFTSVRYLLPALVPAVLLAAPVAGSRWTAFRLVTTGLSVLLGIAVAVADARTANVSRDFVRKVVAPMHASLKGRFLFDGHWGFQYYAEQAGGQITSARKPRWKENDLFVTAKNAFPRLRERPGTSRLAVQKTFFEISPRWPLRTIDCDSIVNFHANVLSNCDRPIPCYLPWGFSNAPSERFDLYVFRRR